ncbi:HlyB/MsbA family ABC transporter [Deinococcus piscis]|uniref:HlyB/MsbA family ABC transporter n=2 Tax=Deinococcus piscis TaxID=394230 RepID=A0ABQ3KAS1_9DEIO|nr:HlyB/MsbA family ABC transporter [Deinococcus piscis]
MSFWVILLTLLRALAPVVNLYVAKMLLDTVAAVLQGTAAGDPWTMLVSALGLQVVALGGFALVSHISQAATELLAEDLKQHCTRLILHKATRLEVPQFEDADVHNSIKRALSDVGMRPLSAMVQAITLIQTLITLLTLTAILLKLGGTIALLLLAAAVPLAWVSFYYNKSSLDVDVAFTESARMQGYLAAVMTSDQAVKELRIFPMANHLMQRWQEHYGRYRQALTALIRNRTAAHSITATLSTLFTGGATLLILKRVVEQSITVGDFMFLTGGITQLQAQFTALANFFAKSHENLLYMEQFFAFTDLEYRDPDQGELWQGEIHDIEFDRVSFTYPLTDRRVLSDISFRATRGEVVAIVGENGAGKSTLIKLLTCLYSPTSGTIRFNGKDISRYSRSSLQHHISAIFQDFGQYHLAASENITAGSPVNAANLELSSRISGANLFLEKLPKQFSNMLGRTFTDGVQLSGGQWQRIALARMYYKKASLYILDEPTSALDSHAEENIITGMEQHKSGKISILITHRMNTASRADQIIVLEQGHIIERGQHAELMRSGATYAEMYNIQAMSFSLPAQPSSLAATA